MTMYSGDEYYGDEITSGLTDFDRDEYLSDFVQVVEPARAPAGAPPAITRERPTFQDIVAWLDEGTAQATDGCWVDMDGSCEHGALSWLVLLDLI